MKHFKDFLIKLQTLDIRISQKKSNRDGILRELNYYDISHESPYLSNTFKNELKELRELALTDILNLPAEQILFQLQRLAELKEKFKKFWYNFNYSITPLGSENFTEYLFSLDLDGIFIVPSLSIQDQAIADDYFIDDLKDTIRAREKTLLEFEQSVLKVIPNNKEPEKPTINKPVNREEAKPVFKEGAAEIFYDLIKDYFKSEDQPLLKNLLTSGLDVSGPLIFKGQGNKLSDAFKQLFEANLIISCNKSELIAWILLHFKYTDKGSVRSYTEKYLQDIISSNTKSCQSPILDVRQKDGHFHILPVKRNNRNYKT